MGKSTFIQTVKVEPTEVQKDEAKDEAIINDYLNNGQYYLDSDAIKFLHDIKHSIDYSYSINPGLKEKMDRYSYMFIVDYNSLRMTWVIEGIPNEICDDEYKTMIEALKKECETTLSDYQNIWSEDEKN